MESESRTAKSLKNAQVSLFYYFANLILGFWARKVFFDYLGSEVLGLDTTAANLLGFLNLAELGIGTSVAYFLYKPIYSKDYLTINKIVALQGWIYRRIATVILLAAAVLMCFFPIIFDNVKIPLWYTYATFSVLLFGSMLGYFINYKSIVLSADQKGYKVSKVTQGALLAVKIFVLLIMPYVAYPFFYYLGMHLFGYVFGSIWLCYVIKKEYPWLTEAGIKGREVLREMPEILTKTKQVFIHRIAGVIFVQVCPFLMYSFTSLTIIAYYGNYLLIVGKLSLLLQTAFASTGAGVGNLIAGADHNRVKKVFWELIDSRLYMSWAALFTIYIVVQPFITVWLGAEYKLNNIIVLLLIIQQGVTMNRTTVDSFLAGNGQFSDIWAPAAEGVFTFILAYGFGYLWGIEGVLAGILLTQSFFVGWWKPYFLFAKGFKWDSFEYFIPFAKRCLMLVVLAFVYRFLFSLYDNSYISNYIEWFVFASVVFTIISVTMFIPFYLFFSGTRDFVKRMEPLIVKKFKRK